MSYLGKVRPTVALKSADIEDGTIVDADINASAAIASSKLSLSLDVNGLSDALVENNSVWLGNDPSGTTDTASNSVAVGTTALDSITTGDDQVAIGYNALTADTTGAQNTAIGSNALDANVSSHGNTAVGYNALTENTGEQNTAVGLGSLDANTSGGYNTAVGYNALGANQVGQKAVAIGYGAAVAWEPTDTGKNITAVGYNALLSNTTSGYNTAVGYQAADAITTGNYAVAIGYEAMTSCTTGAFNVAVGGNALESITTNASSTAVGNEAIRYGTGAQNTAVGEEAFFGVSGSSTGANNTAMGYHALHANTTGASNTAIGHDSGETITTAIHCTAIGRQSLGKDSAAVTGDTNTAIGSGTGNDVTSGANNSFLGYNAGDANSPSGSITSQSNIVCLGNNSTQYLYCATSTITTSDARDKTDVVDFTHGLNFVNQLRPVTYKWDRRSWYIAPDGTSDDILNATPDGSKKTPNIEIGFIGQEVQGIEKSLGYSNSRDDELVVHTNQDSTTVNLKYERIVPILVNAIKELSAEIDSLKAKLGE